MKVIITRRVFRQLDQISAYIEQRSPRGAQHVLSTIQDWIEVLARQPLLGRATDNGQRRIVVSPYPYVIFYRVTADAVLVLRVRHTSRNPAGPLARS